MQTPKVIASHPIWSGRIIDVSSERLLYAGGREHDLDFVRHPGASAVVAVDDDGRVCVVRQYRHGIMDFLWEIPAGKLDKGEPPQACAIRELHEETGVSAARWSPLGTFLPAPGIFTEIIHLYLAQGLKLGAAAPTSSGGGCAASGMTVKPQWPCCGRDTTYNCDAEPAFDRFGLT